MFVHPLTLNLESVTNPVGKGINGKFLARFWLATTSEGFAMTIPVLKLPDVGV